MKKGTEIKLLIEENPSTGYEWVVDQDATDGLFSILALYVPPEDIMNMGTPGHKEFVISVNNKAGKGAFRIA